MNFTFREPHQTLSVKIREKFSLASRAEGERVPFSNTLSILFLKGLASTKNYFTIAYPTGVLSEPNETEERGNIHLKLPQTFQVEGKYQI